MNNYINYNINIQFILWAELGCYMNIHRSLLIDYFKYVKNMVSMKVGYVEIKMSWFISLASFARNRMTLGLMMPHFIN